MKRLLCLIAVLACCFTGASAQAATPIPESPDANDAPAFLGAPATQQPVFVPQPPRHPFMAPNERSNLHDDAFQTDANVLPGPLGKGLSRVSTFFSADCASVTFDSRGRIVTICVGLAGPRLYMLDPRTLDTLASFDLPPRQPGLGSVSPFTDFAGGGYFYLDNLDRAVIPTTTRHVLVVAERGNQPGFVQQRDYDVTSAVPQGDKLVSALPDWSGRLWLVSTNGVVATVNPSSGAVRALDLNEMIGNSFAVDDTGAVYIVSDAAMYAFRAAADGSPQRVWRSTYLNDERSKPGQTEVGSGTTPTVMTSGPWVAITDNGDPIDVVVLDKRTGSQVCSVPVFAKGASDTDQSLVAAGNALVAENNYGYSGPSATEQGGSTAGGLERVDVNAGGKGCTKRWHSDEVAPSVVPKVSLANGLVYTYTKPPGERSDPWYLTTLDLRTGRTIYRARAGAGLGFNNNYAPVTIGPDGTAYVGVLGGLVALRDATPPPVVPQRAAQARPRLSLRLHYGRRSRCTAGRSVSVVLGGRDAGTVRAVTFRYRRMHATDRRRPFATRFRVGSGRLGRRVTASVTLSGGRHVQLAGAVRPCARALAPQFAG